MRRSGKDGCTASHISLVLGFESQPREAKYNPGMKDNADK